MTTKVKKEVKPKTIKVKAVKKLVKKQDSKTSSSIKIVSNITPKSSPAPIKEKFSLASLKPDTSKRKPKAKAVNPLKKIKADDVTVKLPKDISEKLLKRKVFFDSLLSYSSSIRFAKITSFTGYVFILTGLSFSVIGLTIEQNSSDQLSTTTCSTIDCPKLITDNNTALATPPTTTAASIPSVPPAISFPKDFPAELTASFELKVEVNSADNLFINIFSKTTGQITNLPGRLVNTNHYAFIIPVEVLTAGQYVIKAQVYDIGSVTKYNFTGPTFVIKNNLAEVSPEPTTTDVLPATPDKATTTKETLIKTPVSEATTTSSTTPEAEDTPGLNITLQSTSILTLHKILIKPIKLNPNFIEIYAEQKLSNVPRFIGLAAKNDQMWTFTLDSKTLPRGEYNLFAKTSLDNKIVKSPLVKFTAKYQPEPIVINTPDNSSSKAEPVIFTEKLKYNLTESSSTPTTTDNKTGAQLLKQRVDYYSSLEALQGTSTKEGDKAVTGTTDIAREESLRILDSNQKNLNDLLKKYASALQSSDESLMRLAKIELDRYRDSLVTKATTDTRTKDISDAVDKQLINEFERLQEQVERHEDILKKRTNDVIIRDTDNDGITDFDEVSLYNTDPNNPDTDNDGIQDGIEIMTGFDPLNIDADAVIRFHSPRDTNYVSGEEMQILSVLPVIETDANEGGVPIQAEIKGRALPNSYVTLFIYSSPTVVTVRTDEAGEFEYTFTKELEDGEHEIYIALTDNTGNIVVSSEPFKFIKTAEAFTPVDAQEKTIPATPIFSDTQLKSYGVTASMGVVAFGLILLMLGRNLKTRPEDQVLDNKS